MFFAHLKNCAPLRFKYIGVKNSIYYFFIQRIIGINSHVPWPCHHSSIVSSPNKIVRKYWRPYPGYLPGQYINARNGIEIGVNVRIGPAVKLISANHDPLDYDKHIDAGPIIIGNNCWLGSNVVILPEVNLGDHTIVAAGAVVTKSFSGNCIIGGVPARLIKKIPAYEGEIF